VNRQSHAIRAIVFDFDGLILDTEGPEFQAWGEIYAAHGVRLDLATWAVCIGTANVFDPYADLEARVGRPVERDEVRARRRQRNHELLAVQEVQPGVVDYLARAKDLGLGLGVASSSPRSWVAGHLERLGLLESFDCLSCADDVDRVKPDPDLYLLALARLGVSANQAIALEDSPNGILAAKRAGIFCVAIPNPLTSQLSLDHADLRIRSLADVTLEDLLARTALRL